MSEDTRKQLFSVVVERGLYCEYGPPVGTGHTRTPRWEVADISGKLYGKGNDKDEALNEAWRQFQHVTNKS